MSANIGEDERGNAIKNFDFSDDDPSGEQDNPTQWTEASEPVEPMNGHIPERGIYPKDSVLELMVDYVQERSEGADCFITGACLTMIAACLGRNVYFDFGGQKWYPNIFTMIVGYSGDRKSTTIAMVRLFIEGVLPSNRFLPSNFSKEALVDEYDKECGGHPDKVMIVSEGNILIDSWKSGYGESAGKQFLELYDCARLSESFKRNKAKSDDGEGSPVRRVIEETSTSLVMGTTFNACRFSSEGIRSGMHRRFLFCVSEGSDRSTPLPPRSDMNRVEVIKKALLRLVQLKDVECRLSDEARGVWIENHNRINKQKRRGSDEQRSRLASQGNQSMRVAMLFTAAKWCIKGYSTWSGEDREIDAETLKLAIQYVDHCHESARHLDVIANREEIESEAQILHSKIKSKFPGRICNGIAALSKSDLTSAFCNNSKRRGSLAPRDLYERIIPSLERSGKARVRSREGKKVTYEFRVDD